MTALLCLAGALALRYALAAASTGEGRFAWIRHFDNGGGSVYMTRIQLLRSPWVDVYVNVIRQPDSDPLPHNHPWLRMYSVKLWSSYTEIVYWGRGLQMHYPRKPGRFSRVPGVHRISELHGAPAVTLFVGIGRRRSWGFFDTTGGRCTFIPHQERGKRGQ